MTRRPLAAALPVLGGLIALRLASLARHGVASGTVRRVENTLRPAAELLDRRGAWTTASGPRVPAIADPMRLQQGLSNAMDNALRYRYRYGDVLVHTRFDDPTR